MPSIEDYAKAAELQTRISLSTTKIMARCGKAADNGEPHRIPAELRQAFVDLSNGKPTSTPIREMVAAYVEREILAGRDPLDQEF